MRTLFRIIGLFGLTAASVLLAVAMVEGMTRVAHITVHLDHEGLLSPYSHRIASRSYIFENMGMARQWGPEARHIAVVGDSFGVSGLYDGVTAYPDLLADYLHRRGTDAEVYNFSVPGFNSDQAYKIITDVILPMKPDVLVWQFYTNDLWENVVRPLYTLSRDGQLVAEPASKNWVYQRQRLFEALPYRYQLLDMTVIRLVLKAFESRRYAQAPGTSDIERYRWSAEKVRREVATVRNLAQAAGIRVVYVLIPPQAEYIERTPRAVGYDETRASYRYLAGVLGSEQYYYAPDFARLPEHPDVAGAATPSAAIATRYYVGSDDPNVPGNKHLNAEGQLIVAEALADRIHFLMEDAR